MLVILCLFVIQNLQVFFSGFSLALAFTKRQCNDRCGGRSAGQNDHGTRNLITTEQIIVHGFGERNGTALDQGERTRKKG